MQVPHHAAGCSAFLPPACLSCVIVSFLLRAPMAALQSRLDVLRYWCRLVQQVCACCFQECFLVAYVLSHTKYLTVGSRLFPTVVVVCSLHASGPT